MSDEPEVDDRSETVSRARDAALHLLSFRARSVTEMERRLRKKDFDESVVSEVVTRLLDLGYLDDREFARQFLEERLRRRPRGPFALVQELQKRGVDRGLAEEVLDALMAEREIDEADLARSTARRWLSRQSRKVVVVLESGGSPSSPDTTGSDPADGDAAREAFRKARRRLYGHLERKGFSRGVIREVVRDLLDEMEGG
ncbi:MAG: regulatory protein RecX [Longimicrobiales bacterium]|nr:regulatory protein RecX [Longimicrobiales bacterium]